jgi:hypothetical protein
LELKATDVAAVAVDPAAAARVPEPRVDPPTRKVTVPVGLAVPLLGVTVEESCRLMDPSELLTVVAFAVVVVAVKEPFRTTFRLVEALPL